MNPNLEIEYKMLISENEYQTLLKTYKKAPILQTNVYYDSVNSPLKQRGIGMRIRDLNDTHLFTLKVKNELGHDEYETNTKENSINALCQKEVMDIFASLNISGPFIESGRLDTWRSEIECEYGYLCLDRNSYYGITDYELEFEIYPNQDAELGMKEFENILKQINLTYIKNKKSKIQRCLEARKEKEMKKTALFCAHGFEECEGLIVVDLLRRANIDVKIVSIENTLNVISSHNIKLECDCLFDDVNFDELDMIILPGGMPGTTHLKGHQKLCDKIVEFNKQKKYLAAICAAPSVFGKLGLLENITMTCYPGFEKECLNANYTGNKVEKDQHFITAKGLGAAIEFAEVIIETLKDNETANQVLKTIQY